MITVLSPFALVLLLPLLVRCKWANPTAAWRWSFMILFLAYPQCTEMGASYFHCEGLSDGNSYLVADYDVQCWTGAHQSYLVPAIILVVAYALGIPCYFLAQLWSCNSAGELFDRAGQRDELGRPIVLDAETSE